MSKSLVLKILMAIGVAGSALASAGVIPGGAVLVGFFSALTGSAGLFHPTPEAVATFGAAAK